MSGLEGDAIALCNSMSDNCILIRCQTFENRSCDIRNVAPKFDLCFGQKRDADCWMMTSKRPACLMKQFNLLEIASTCSAAASHGCRSSGVFCAVDSAALQPVHRCTPAPHGTLAVPAALPTHSFGDVDHW